MLRITILFLGLLIASSAFGQTLTIYRSTESVDKTVEKIVNEIQSNASLIYFETVYHDSIANKRGMKLAPTRSILFEDPNLTTQLLSCRQTAALDLPLEIIVWEELGDVYIGFIDPKFMTRRFMITDCNDVIQQLTRLMIKISMNAIREMK